MKNIPYEIENIIKTLEKNGFEGYIVGGCVRDILLGHTPNDFDITTSALPEEIKQIFQKTVDTGIKHGTVTVITENGTPIEITTYRTENGYDDMRHPKEVKFVRNIKDDLARRDFTVNAMAYNKKTGLVDLFGGQHDVEKKILKTVGDADKRFSEDALRIMRLFRFSSTLNFKIERKTYKSALNLCENLKNISPERIWSELSKTLTGDNPNVILPLIKSGGLSFFGISGGKNLKPLSLIGKKEDLRFFAFCKILNLNFLDIIKNLKIKNSIKNYCEKAEKILFINKKSTDGEIKFALSIAGADILYDICDYKKLANIKQKAQRIIESAEPYKISHLAITGDDLLKMGIPDKQIGEALNILCQNVREHPENNSLEKLKDIINNSN